MSEIVQLQSWADMRADQLRYVWFRGVQTLKTDKAGQEVYLETLLWAAQTPVQPCVLGKLAGEQRELRSGHLQHSSSDYSAEHEMQRPIGVTEWPSQVAKDTSRDGK